MAEGMTRYYKLKAKELADKFGYDIEKTWSQLTLVEKRNVEKAMQDVAATSINGCSGWFMLQRYRHRFRD